MAQAHLHPMVAPFGPLSALLLDAMRQITPPRVVGWHQPKHMKKVLGGQTELCHGLDRTLAEMLAARHYLTDDLLLLPSTMRAYIRRVRNVRVLRFDEACEREQRAHCALDPVQVHALVTGSLGDLYRLLPFLTAQEEATQDLTVATQHRIAALEGRNPEALVA